jgi:hypothetical protein
MTRTVHTKECLPPLSSHIPPHFSATIDQRHLTPYPRTDATAGTLSHGSRRNLGLTGAIRQIHHVDTGRACCLSRSIVTSPIRK